MDLNISTELNASQRAAVEYCDGPQLVIAGAGSGKTRVLTYKIAYLLSLGLNPWSILALTFTNKAAREMKERIAGLVGAALSHDLVMGTFHSVFSRILRREAEHIGYNSNFTIYDQADSRSLVKSIIGEMKLDEKKYKPAVVASRISMAKNHLITSVAYASSPAAKDDAMMQMSAIKDIFVHYVQRCKQANAMDFDDLLVNTYKLFRDNEEVRLKYSGLFDYILVDEYQDTNYAQQEIVRQLSREKQKVCVVGDDAQSIYSFRGAEIQNILNFRSIYPGARLFKLEQNYRSTQTIVECANSLILRNREQIAKRVFSTKEKGDLVEVRSAVSDKEEAIIVCTEIKKMMKMEGGNYGDFAILYRTNAQSRSFEEFMRRTNIPYKIYGGLSFYQRKEIKDAIAYFRLVANPDDEEAFKRVINYPARGIGDTTLTRIVNAANAHETSLWQVVSHPAEHDLQVGSAALSRLSSFCKMVSGWMERLVISDACSLGGDIIRESGMREDIFNGKLPEDLSRQENIEEFLAGLQDFVQGRREEGLGDHVSIVDFLQEVALLTDLDSNDGEGPHVSLMTVHSAKGLEFPTVFVVGLEENIFPSPRAAATNKGLEEERRLLYVAITRAQRHCILTYARTRLRYGSVEYDSPSRFLKDIDKKLLRMDSNRGMANTSPQNESTRFTGWRRISKPTETTRRIGGQHTFASDTLSSGSSAFTSRVTGTSVSTSRGSGTSMSAHLSVGSIVEHQRFGIGKVEHLEGEGDNAKATVVFNNAGRRQLLLKFAKLRVLS